MFVLDVMKCATAVNRKKNIQRLKPNRNFNVKNEELSTQFTLTTNSKVYWSRRNLLS